VDAGHTVLLLEAGGSDHSPFIKLPAAVWRLRPQHDWGYRAQPDPSRNGVVDDWHRGRVLGGTSSINGMIYVRGSAPDFDRWASLCGGVGGWSANEVLQVFRELEHSDQVGPMRGRHGLLHVRTVKRPHPVTEAFVESAHVSGHLFNADYNGATQEGTGYLQYTQFRGLRWSAADAFVKPIRRRRNFGLRLGALVERVELSNGRATAVIFRHKGTICREAGREITLCAGAINTPKLLMLSGIGDPAELDQHKISVITELPAVGRNLKEHPCIGMSFRTKVPTYNLTQGFIQRLGIVAKYLLHREGPIANAYEATVFLRLTRPVGAPELQVYFAPIGWARKDGVSRLTSFPAVKLFIARSHTESSGRIKLASADPAEPPTIESHVLEKDADLEMLVRGIQAVRAMMGARPVAELLEAEIEPGRSVATAHALRDYIRRDSSLCCHALGTCRMGLGTDSVVGPDLRVHGTENLWIADASIMPDAISANLNAVCMMIGAKLGKQFVERSLRAHVARGSRAACQSKVAANE